MELCFGGGCVFLFLFTWGEGFFFVLFRNTSFEGEDDHINFDQMSLEKAVLLLLMKQMRNKCENQIHRQSFLK